ncbi:ZIP zinc transporter domain-containing protein [Ditylenchus destructor]|nr:ZIP zinc transporter domain-containing protein [Ditylenchus destructor]
MLTVGLLSRIVKHLVSLSTGVAAVDRAAACAARGLRERRRSASPVPGAVGGSDVLLPAGEGRALPPHPPSRGGRPHHHHHFDREQAGRGGLSVLVGDSIHNFCDGIIIAAAFLADHHLGWVTAMAIIAHEIPQEVGDYIVLLNAGFSRRKALFFNAVSGMAAVVGGLVGYFIVGPWQQLFPSCWWRRRAASSMSRWPT